MDDILAHHAKGFYAVAFGAAIRHLVCNAEMKH